MQVVFHTGAHYTDDGRLLKCLLNNKDDFRKRNVAVPGPGKYRTLLKDAFAALDGTVPPRDVPASEPLSDLVRWVGPAPRETDEVETGTLRENPSWSLGGRRNAIDEHAFNPQRAQVTTGTRVRFINNGEMAHTIAARDGSWTTGTIVPGLFEYVAFDSPGMFLFHCTDHPWALGEITVAP